MNIQQANLLLEKINGLHKSIWLDGELSTIERDLMMSYIRQLYEAYLGTEALAAARPAKQVKVVEVKATPKPIVKEVPKVVVPPPPPPPVAPPPVAPPAPVASTPQPEPVSIPAATPAVSRASPAVEALFSHKQAKELSEKLSQQNIADLTKALSINDKLLYSNELFDRDMASMNKTLVSLNKLSSMREAKTVLIQIADENNWGDSERSEVAESFIKMVRRRY